MGRRRKKAGSDTTKAPQSGRPPRPENLATLALAISLEVRTAMMASYVTYLAGLWFHRFSDDDRRRLFRMSPANTLTYQALKALEGRAIVTIYETIKDEDRLLPHDTNLPSKSDLQLHRHAVSHPAETKWHTAKMQDFADAGRKYTDFRAALVWDLQRSINEKLRTHNMATHNEEIPVTYEMAASLHLILDLSRKPECPIPSVDKLLADMQAGVVKYTNLLERHPDGARNPQKEEERRERWRAMWERASKKWAQAAATNSETSTLDTDDRE